MIFTKINAIKDNLTDNEKKIVEYLKNNCNDSKIMTSTEIASRINVSQPSVIRLSKKLGYSSFREMLADLPNEEDTIEDRSLQDGESDEETLLKISTQMCEIIESTRDVNDLKDIQRCVRMINEAPSVILFGVESSNLFAHYMANQLTKLGIVALTSENYHTTLMQINNDSKDSVCFLFSETGETEEVLRVASLSKKLGLKTVALTRNVKNSLYSYADIVLKTVTFDTITRFNVTTMRTSMLYIIDVIYLLILKSDFNKYNKHIERSEELTHLKDKSRNY